MARVRSKQSEEEIKVDMTPMIDIVFQLLVFFIMTFKIVPM
ncbi:MAG: biopolymer transporter ExbD, partial [Planctomycetota bacterium]